LGDGVDGRKYFVDSFRFCGDLIRADFAGEIPLIEAFREFFAALAFQVFAYLKLHCFDDTRVDYARLLERESFLHSPSYSTNRRLWNLELWKAGNGRAEMGCFAIAETFAGGSEGSGIPWRFA